MSIPRKILWSFVGWWAIGMVVGIVGLFGPGIVVAVEAFMEHAEPIVKILIVWAAASIVTALIWDVIEDDWRQV